MKFLRFLLIILLIPLPSSLAEYRAYELLIENEKMGTQRRVVTTLDPQQYPNYYPLRKEERIALIQSWMCWGTSDYHQNICPAPNKKRDEERFPSSL